MGKAGSGTQSTKAKSTRRTARKLVTKDLPVKLRFHQDLMLYAIDGAVPLAVAASWFALLHADLDSARKPGDEWAVFGGTTARHWRGFTTWLAISLSAHDALGAYLQEPLKKYPFEASEFCRPASVAELEPIFRVSDDGFEFLEGACISPESELGGFETDLPVTTNRAWIRED
ncbi:MAG: hypothetical protein AB1730_20345 [Myxococcota bacterium]|jgi:hypothetical protein